MKFILSSLFILLLCSPTIYSQEVPKIQVQGQATVSAIPEMMNVRIPVEAQALEYQDCVAKLTSVYNKLEKAIVEAGYSKESLKSSGLSVNERYTYNGQKRQKDGYSGSMSIQLEMKHTDRSMNDIIKVLGRPEFNFGFSLSYKLSEKQQKELSTAALKGAVSDARMKAFTMVEAIGKDLGGVLLMNYNTQSAPSPVRYDSMMKAESGSIQDVSLNPNEIEISRSVIIHYSIAN